MHDISDFRDVLERLNLHTEQNGFEETKLESPKILMLHEFL